MLMSSHLHQAFSLISEVDSHSPSPLGDLDRRMKAMLNDDPVAPNLAMSWDLAASRPSCSDAIANMRGTTTPSSPTQFR
jgi:hypothetical protein